jgi:hypothetical protein
MKHFPKLKKRKYQRKNPILAARKISVDGISYLSHIEVQIGKVKYINSLSEDIKANKEFIYELLDFYTYTSQEIVQEFLTPIFSNYISKSNDALLLIDLIKSQAADYDFSEDYFPNTDIYLHLINKKIVNTAIPGKTKPKLTIKELYLILNAFTFARIETINKKFPSPLWVGLGAISINGFKDQKSKNFYKKLVQIKGLPAFQANAIPEKYYNDKDFMIHAMNKNYRALKYASWRIKSDPDVLYVAYKKNPNSLKQLLTKKWILKLNLRRFSSLMQKEIYKAFMTRVKETDVMVLANIKKDFLKKTSCKNIIN